MGERAIDGLRMELANSGFESIVHGEGDAHAELVLVGEAPGSKEVELGRPFVGAAGKNLDVFLEILGLERKEIYITNVVKIRPYRINSKTGRKNNRPPNREEVDFFKSHLLKELEIVKPKWVVTLGNTALRAVSGKKDISISDVHGRPIESNDGRTCIFPLYHPAAIIYNRALKPVYMEDLVKLKEHIYRKEQA